MDEAKEIERLYEYGQDHDLPRAFKQMTALARRLLEELDEARILEERHLRQVGHAEAAIGAANERAERAREEALEEALNICKVKMYGTAIEAGIRALKSGKKTKRT